MSFVASYKRRSIRGVGGVGVGVGIRTLLGRVAWLLASCLLAWAIFVAVELAKEAMRMASRTTTAERGGGGDQSTFNYSETAGGHNCSCPIRSEEDGVRNLAWSLKLNQRQQQ